VSARSLPTAPAVRAGPSAPPDSGHEVDGLRLVGFECSLDTTPIDSLDRYSQRVDSAQVTRWFEMLHDTEEVAVLSTCHRVELLALVRSAEEVEQWAACLGADPPDWRRREGTSLVQHVFRVAGGRHSLAVGEKEVRAQVRAAAGRVWSRHPRTLLRDLLLSAAETADQAAPTVPSSRSIAAVAASRVLATVGRPFPRVLVIGSGVVGRQVAELLSPGARVTIAYRSRPPDDAFLRTTGARACPADQIPAEIRLADAVVTAAKSGDRCLGPAELPGPPLVLVDLGVPRNVDPAVRDRPGVTLLDLGDLRAYGSPLPEDLEGEAILEAGARACAERLARLALEPWVDRVRREAERLRARELETARSFLGELTPAQQEAIDRLTRRLVSRLLAGPTDRLRALPPGPDGDRWRRFALELLRPVPYDT
jgi:glutamyl-tRNA reductase